LQTILHYSPLLVGLAFLPGNLIMAVFSVGLSAKVVMRYGTKKPLAIGMLFVAAGLVLFALAPADGSFWIHIIPAMSLMGFGAGLAFNPVLIAATSEVPPHESGLASGVLNTAFMMGGSLGLAILASVAAVRSSSLLASGTDQMTALLSGYHMAFMIGAIFAVGAAELAAFYIREPKNMGGGHMMTH
jgi:MFS family permease